MLTTLAAERPRSDVADSADATGADAVGRDTVGRSSINVSPRAHERVTPRSKESNQQIWFDSNSTHLRRIATSCCLCVCMRGALLSARDGLAARSRVAVRTGCALSRCSICGSKNCVPSYWPVLKTRAYTKLISRDYGSGKRNQHLPLSAALAPPSCTQMIQLVTEILFGRCTSHCNTAVIVSPYEILPSVMSPRHLYTAVHLRQQNNDNTSRILNGIEVLLAAVITKTAHTYTILAIAFNKEGPPDPLLRYGLCFCLQLPQPLASPAPAVAAPEDPAAAEPPPCPATTDLRCQTPAAAAVVTLRPPPHCFYHCCCWCQA